MMNKSFDLMNKNSDISDENFNQMSKRSDLTIQRFGFDEQKLWFDEQKLLFDGQKFGFVENDNLNKYDLNFIVQELTIDLPTTLADQHIINQLFDYFLDLNISILYSMMLFDIGNALLPRNGSIICWQTRTFLFMITRNQIV